MKFVVENSFIVINGKWNKFIFTPEWVNKFLLNDENLKIEIPLNSDGSVRCSTENLRVFTFGDQFHISLLSHKHHILEQVNEILFKLVDYLPHTPVNAFGVNFKFIETINTPKLDNLFCQIKPFFNNENLIIENQSNIDHGVLNFRIKRTDGKFEIGFNYHYPLSNLVEIKEKFDSNTITGLWSESLKFVESKFDMEWEDKNNG